MYTVPALRMEFSASRWGCMVETYWECILTYSMVQSPSLEANWFAANQEITRISRNPKVHYRTHKRPPPVPTLGQPNPDQIHTSHLLEIHSNIIHPSTPWSPQWLLGLRVHTVSKWCREFEIGRKSFYHNDRTGQHSTSRTERNVEICPLYWFCSS